MMFDFPRLCPLGKIPQLPAVPPRERTEFSHLGDFPRPWRVTMDLTRSEYLCKRAAMRHRVGKWRKEATPLRARLKALDENIARWEAKIVQLDEEESR